MSPTFLLLFTLMGEPVTYATGYIPNIQFTPFYVAIAKGFYTQEGIDLELDYTMGPDVYKLVALNRIQFGSADPDAFLHAVTRHVPLVHIATLYQRSPIALIARRGDLTTQSLKGKRIGIVGPYGSSYLGYKAILSQLELKLVDVNTVPIGYTQVAALMKDQVDAVVGYINHEPVRLNNEGITTQTLQLQQAHQIPGVGLMTNTEFAKSHPGLVASFLRATFAGIDYVLKHPEESYRIAVDEFIKERKGQDRTEYEVLLKTLPFWESDYTREHGLGQCDPKLWHNMAQLLTEQDANPAYSDWQQHVNRTFTFRPDSP